MKSSYDDRQMTDAYQADRPICQAVNATSISRVRIESLTPRPESGCIVDHVTIVLYEEGPCRQDRSLGSSSSSLPASGARGLLAGSSSAHLSMAFCEKDRSGGRLRRRPNSIGVVKRPER
jgi:hypothetical protein